MIITNIFSLADNYWKRSHFDMRGTGKAHHRMDSSQHRENTAAQASCCLQMRLTECSEGHCHRGEFLRTDFLLSPHENRHFSRSQRMYPASKSDLCTQHQLLAFLIPCSLYQTLGDRLSKIVGNTCPKWNPEKDEDM